MNFDRVLHFRPNLQGARGKLELKSADDYWKALEAELFVLNLAPLKVTLLPSKEEQGYWQTIMKTSRKRLPRIFEVIRDISGQGAEESLCADEGRACG